MYLKSANTLVYKKDETSTHNLMPYMFINLHIEDVYMLDFNEVIADALNKIPEEERNNELP